MVFWKTNLSRCALIVVVSCLGGSTNAQLSIATVSNSESSAMPISLDAQKINLTQGLTASPRSYNGTVLLCGGGGLPRHIREVFHEIAQGPQGSLVIIPTASPLSDQGDYAAWLDYWASFQWKQVSVVHAKTRDEAFLQSESIEALKNATAVWISGGDQKRLADRYVGTPIEQELHGVLHRGGIVGGTSAGAAIASKVMIAGGSTEPMFGNGLQFLPNAIVDQHFSEKNRHERLAKAIEAHPSRLGLGIDESTGLFISKEKSRIVGAGSVFLFRQDGNGIGSRKLTSDDAIHFDEEDLFR